MDEMTENTSLAFPIQKAERSKISEVNFQDLTFGSVFTDHMLVCDYLNGQWGVPFIVPYAPLSLEPSARVFHYGQAIFEGMKAYKDDDGTIWLFRPDENFRRLNRSAERLGMPVLPSEYFFEGLRTLLQLEKDWVRKGTGNSLYIRPFMIATEPSVLASPSSQYKFLIILSPARSYYAGEVRVRIEEHYSRAASGGTGYAKAAGNYAAQFYPTKLAQKSGFQQVVWTDSDTHQFLEEAGTMNLFFRIDDRLITAPVSDRILDGVTRKSVLTIAKEMGISTEVRRVTVNEVIDAAREGSLREIFGAGTAAVINPIQGFGYKDFQYELPVLENSFSTTIKQRLVNIQHNKVPDPYGWRFKI